MGLGLEPSMVGADSPVRFVSNKELEDLERKQAELKQQSPKITGLVGYLKTKWQQAQEAKEPIQDELLRAQRQLKGVYDQDKLESIRKQGGTELYMMLTAAKHRAAVAWIKDVMLNSQEDCWDLRPTEIPELSEEQSFQIQEQVYQEAMRQADAIIAADGVITEEELLSIRSWLVQSLDEILDQALKQEKDFAEETAEKMKEKIRDQLAEGGFHKAIDEFIEDFVGYKAAFLKGPIVRKRKRVNWSQGAGGYEPVETEEVQIEFERRSPFDIYPLPDTTDIEDGGYFDRIRLSVSDLNAMKGVEGYDEEAINAVIKEYGKGGLREWLSHDNERAENEDRPYEYINAGGTIEALEFYGCVPGFVLKEHGWDEIEDDNQAYEITALMIGRWVCMSMLNPSPLGKRPFTKACYQNVPGSFWGQGLPELMEDIQQVCNSTARAIVNNMSVASGPQVAINDVNRIPEGEEITSIYPWKIWQFTPDIQSNGQRPIEFFQPSMMSQELLKVYDYFSDLADDYTGIPAYVQGNDDAKGAGNTASGLSMIMTHASRGIKGAISHIDEGVIKPLITNIFVHNMLYDEDESIKGDVEIVPMGALHLFNKEQAQIRRNEFLMATNNPVDLQIIGSQGRANLLREVAKTLDMPGADIVPDEDEFLIQQQQMLQQQMIQQQSLDPAGNPVSGQDAALFQQ